MAPLIVEDTFHVGQADFISYFVIDRKSKVKVNSMFCDLFPQVMGVCYGIRCSSFLLQILIFYRGTNMDTVEIQLQLVFVNQNNNVLLKMAKNSLIDTKRENGSRKSKDRQQKKYDKRINNEKQSITQ